MLDRGLVGDELRVVEPEACGPRGAMVIGLRTGLEYCFLICGLPMVGLSWAESSWGACVGDTGV